MNIKIMLNTEMTQFLIHLNKENTCVHSSYNGMQNLGKEVVYLCSVQNVSYYFPATFDNFTAILIISNHIPLIYISKRKIMNRPNPTSIRSYVRNRVCHFQTARRYNRITEHALYITWFVYTLLFYYISHNPYIYPCLAVTRPLLGSKQHSKVNALCIRCAPY